MEDRNRSQKHVQRARIILLSAERLTVLDVAACKWGEPAVGKAGLTSASMQPSTISDAAKRNVGRAYKQDARALGANHPRAKPVGVEPTTAEQTARNASPVPRTPEQVPPQRRVVDRVPILPEVRPVSGDRGATMLGSPPPQVLAEAPKRPVDVMINFVPTIMPTAPCQEQRSEGEPQTNDDMPAPWK